MSSPRICIVGAGPSGMNLLGFLKQMQQQGEKLDVTCFEKQNKPGGLWNFTWRTGIDEFGCPVHCSQYQNLFSNGPKECLEFPDYTFADHFGKAIPSFPPRPVLEDYLRGYWRSLGIVDGDVETNHCVRDVTFCAESKTFAVRVSDLCSNRDKIEKFDYLVVATGHFSTPNSPPFDGIESFEGRVLHAHDFRNAREFKGQRVVIVGSSYSAEDIALQCYKFGAESVTISYRSSPMGFKWPDKVEEVPLLVRITGKTCHFKDGSQKDADSIIMCTGYQHHFPFMPEELRLKSANIYYPPNLYRSLQWYGNEQRTVDADGRLFYMGMQDQFYTFTMFMVQALWVAKVITGHVIVPSAEDCKKSIEEDQLKNEQLTDGKKQIKAQTEYLKLLADDVGYERSLDVSQLFLDWKHDKEDDILTYRDKSFTSIFSSHKSPVHQTPWLRCFNDSLENYLEDA